MTDFDETLKECQEDLDLLRQNGLLDEGCFITFVKDHGVPVSGVITGDPGDFNRRSWLSSDGINHNGGLLFHPFRLITLCKLFEACKINIATSSTLQRGSVLKLVEHVLSRMHSDEQIGERARRWDGVANLAILFEPI